MLKSKVPHWMFMTLYQFRATLDSLATSYVKQPSATSQHQHNK
jgi:hypothetical protein